MSRILIKGNCPVYTTGLFLVQEVGSQKIIMVIFDKNLPTINEEHKCKLSLKVSDKHYSGISEYILIIC